MGLNLAEQVAQATVRPAQSEEVSVKCIVLYRGEWFNERSISKRPTSSITAFSLSLGRSARLPKSISLAELRSMFRGVGLSSIGALYAGSTGPPLLETTVLSECSAETDEEGHMLLYTHL